MEKNLKSFVKYGLIILALLISCLPLINPFQVFSNLQNFSFDTFQRVLPRKPYAEDPVVVIDIDDKSLEQIGQWPWSRNQLAKLTDGAFSAAALGFDVVFAESDRTNPKNLIAEYPENKLLQKELSLLPDNDEVFAESIANHGTVVLGQALNNKAETKKEIIKKFGWSFRLAGFDALNYCLLAEGKVDVVIEANLKPYDVLPLIPIIKNSGALITNWKNQPAENGGNIIATSNKKLHKKILKILRKFTKRYIWF